MAWISRLLREEGFSLLRSCVVSVGIKAAGIALVMASTVVLARCLGPADYGRFAFIQSTAMVLASLSTLGFRESSNKIVSRYAVRRRRLPLGRFLLFGIAIITGGSFVLGAIGHGAITASPAMASKYGFSVWAMIGMVVSSALLLFLAPALVALGRPVLSFTIENFGPRGIVLAAVAMLVASGLHLTTRLALDVTIIGNLAPAAAIVLFAFIRFRLPLGVPWRFPAAARTGRAWLYISLFMMTSPVISLAFSETSIIVLGAAAPPGEVALFQIARRLPDLATVCGAVAIYLALPSIARFHAERRIDRLQRTIDITNLMTVVPGLCVLLVLLVGGREILSVFGPAFVGAYAAMLILSAGRVAEQLFGPVLEVLLMTGQHATASAINLTFAVTNIVVNCVLVPIWGPIGAAAGTVAVILLWKASLYRVLRARSPVETCLPLRAMGRLLRGATPAPVAPR